MKYLHDDRLAELTQDLTDRTIGAQRVLNGRLETFSMKRGTDDKKYAFKLGEKFVASLEHLAQDAVQQRKRSHSVDLLLDMAAEPRAKLPRRVRATSLGEAPPLKDYLDSKATTTWKPVKPEALPKKSGVMPCALGDFANQGTRRLMVSW